MANSCIKLLKFIPAFVLLVIVLMLPMLVLPNKVGALYFLCISALLYKCIKHNRSEVVENENENEMRSFWPRWEPYRPNSQVDTSSNTITEIASLAIRALPPVKSFDGEETKECPICLEEFNNGELIQSFGVCTHEFHTPCLNSWLRGGKATCPVCRQDMLSNC